MKIIINKIGFFALVALAFTDQTFAKNAGDLLDIHLERPGFGVRKEVLALVEITSVEVDPKPEANWIETGTLRLRLIEAVGAEMPEKLSVRYYKRDVFIDAWTWDDAELQKGRRLLGFFNQWNKEWAVRKDGYSNIINNPENIRGGLLARVQTLFKTELIQQK